MRHIRSTAQDVYCDVSRVGGTLDRSIKTMLGIAYNSFSEISRVDPESKQNRFLQYQNEVLLSEGYRESRRCSRDTYPESYITKYTSIRRLKHLGLKVKLKVRNETCGD